MLFTAFMISLVIGSVSHFLEWIRFPDSMDMKYFPSNPFDSCRAIACIALASVLFNVPILPPGLEINEYDYTEPRENDPDMPIQDDGEEDIEQRLIPDDVNDANPISDDDQSTQSTNELIEEMAGNEERLENGDHINDGDDEEIIPMVEYV